MGDLTKLDQEVAEALNLNISGKPTSFTWVTDSLGTHRFHPSTDGAQAMGLLVGKSYSMGGDPHSHACDLFIGHSRGSGTGPTPEIAICRAVVAACKGEGDVAQT